MLRGVWHEVVDRLFGDRHNEKLSPEERRELFQNEPTFLRSPPFSNIGIRGWSPPGSDVYHTTYFSRDHHNPDLHLANTKTNSDYQGEVLQTVFERTTRLILAINLEAEVFLNDVRTGNQQLIVLNLPKEESQHINNVDYWQEELRKRDLDVDHKSLNISLTREHRLKLTCKIHEEQYDFYELFLESSDRRVLVCLKEKSPHPSTKRGHPIRPDVVLPALVRA